jgi:hypothetical protein
MNKKVFVISVALMAVAMLAAPVMAVPATKIEGVTLTALLSITDEGVGREVDHGILQTRETTMAETVTLAIPG